jgi:hypothetical protein
VTVREFYVDNALAYFDAMDRAFYRASGMLAPGKAYPLADCMPPEDEVRRARWRAWMDLLGPPDVAAIIGLALMPEDDE